MLVVTISLAVCFTQSVFWNEPSSPLQTFWLKTLNVDRQDHAKFFLRPEIAPSPHLSPAEQLPACCWVNANRHPFLWLVVVALMVLCTGTVESSLSTAICHRQQRAVLPTVLGPGVCNVLAAKLRQHTWLCVVNWLIQYQFVFSHFPSQVCIFFQCRCPK